MLAEEAVPQALLVHGRGQGVGGAGDGSGGGHGGSCQERGQVFVPAAWNSPAVERVGSIRTSCFLPASQAR